ncbi:MAG: DUF2249 domain-containing protein [Haloarculaceae archaeon]
MEAIDPLLDRTDAPAGRPHELLEAAELPPPEPLRRTLERLAELDDRTVLVQVNDRAPQHLYPRLAERGYEYDTVETDDGVVTVVWKD